MPHILRVERIYIFCGINGGKDLLLVKMPRQRQLHHTEESRQRMAMLDRKLAEKKNGKKPTQPEQKEEPHEREDH